MAVHHRTSVEEEDSGDLSPNQRVDQPAVVLAGRGRASRSAQPDHGWLGATTSATGLSANRTGPSPNMPAAGSVGGCVRSTRCRVGHVHATRTNTCTRSLAWSSFVCLTSTSRGRTHESLSESRMREIRTSGLMSGRWKRSMVWLVRHRQTKGPATDRPNLNHRATSRLYTVSEASPSSFGVLPSPPVEATQRRNPTTP